MRAAPWVVGIVVVTAITVGASGNGASSVATVGRSRASFLTGDGLPSIRTTTPGVDTTSSEDSTTVAPTSDVSTVERASTTTTNQSVVTGAVPAASTLTKDAAAANAQQAGSLTLTSTTPATRVVPPPTPRQSVPPDNVEPPAPATGRGLVWTSAGMIHWKPDAVRALKADGVGGWAASSGFLPGLGGTADQQTMWSTIPSEVGQPVYLGVYLTNYWNQQTPLARWNDDAGWSQVVSAFRDLARFGRQSGWAGIALDHEPYPTSTGKNDNMWTWQSSGLAEATARSLAQQRGRQVMDAIVAEWPGVRLINYGARMPGGWDAKVQAAINNIPNAFSDWLTPDFWAGMTSGDGWGSVTFLDAIHYKSPQLTMAPWYATWDTALTYDRNAYQALFAARFGHPERVQWAPFGWIDSSPSEPFSAVRPPDYVQGQYDAFRRDSTSWVGIYDYGGLTFNYSPYAAAIHG